MSDDPYNPAVRAAFENPVHAGDIEGRYAVQAHVMVASSAHGDRLALSAGVDDGIIAVLRFRAWGCPHLIAAAEWVCTRLEGQPLAALAVLPSAELTAALSVPVTKTGKLLLVEDALRALHGKLAPQQ